MKKYFRSNLKIIFTFLSVVLIACNAEDGADGYNSLISTEIEPNGSNCEAGGIKINYGLDLNRNGILDENEIENSEYICNGQGGTLELDNLVRLEITDNNLVTCGLEWKLGEGDLYQMHHFNKNHYANVSSIVFVPSMRTDYENVTVYVELYNVTDGVSIENSQVEQNNTGVMEYKYSENIFNHLPDHTITLGIRIKTTEYNGEYCGHSGKTYLFIFRE